MTHNQFVPLNHTPRLPDTEMKKRASDFLEEMKGRRTVRDFSDQPVHPRIIEDCLRTACTAPSGANKQPWKFMVITDQNVKTGIRKQAEAIESEFYKEQATKSWVNDLRPLGTGPDKSFLETAPCLIIIFSLSYHIDANGNKHKHYYVSESVGIATGLLITAFHHAGLSTLTYTPAKMRFLNKLLKKPLNEKPFMILVTGFTAENARVPVLARKPYHEAVEWV